jgi:hypothetical protein
LTLAILARSVRLFSHDRTKEQRLREGGKFALLSVRAAFLPALFAVLLLGSQLTFWENAIAGTGEMIDLLVFAFLISVPAGVSDIPKREAVERHGLCLWIGHGQ